MSADAIAAVIADLRDGRWWHPVPDGFAPPGDMAPLVVDCVESAPVVDATPMYYQIAGSDDPIDLYNTFEIHEVWPEATVCYVNQHGNVHVGLSGFINWQPWDTPNDVDWGRVVRVASLSMFVGGRGRGKPVPTVGPMVQLRSAVDADGQILDLHHEALAPNIDEDFWVNMMLVWLQTYTLAACVNVELVDPKRPRAQRRRLERTGVTPQTLVIRPRSKSTRSRSAGPERATVGDTPQSFVRGHFAEYGDRYGKGKLFGRYEGRFWIPAHGRAGRDGRTVDYRVDPNG